MIHRCPHPKCEAKIPDHLFACRPHWFKLSGLARGAIWDTVGLPLSDSRRHAAIVRALAEWRATS